ncbi:hypothetical protein THAOC_32878 [Thalassiosira oceanica]|uniref:PUM-HD domain-containing protein n=1 Tax=Thalassiosira oceanica TaxID=159749 RepID=K0RHC8_THAOC|nr:hypothetical protein THAOC_32878 [Thalassiosira oceanica]|eukprot:EJK48336.1 hypothetical protein THAOC_32878 [Thalassiosira oceanica]
MVACLFANKQPNIKAEQPLLSPGGRGGSEKSRCCRRFNLSRDRLMSEVELLGMADSGKMLDDAPDDADDVADSHDAAAATGSAETERRDDHQDHVALNDFRLQDGAYYNETQRSALSPQDSVGSEVAYEAAYYNYPQQLDPSMYSPQGYHGYNVAAAPYGGPAAAYAPSPNYFVGYYHQYAPHQYGVPYPPPPRLPFMYGTAGPANNRTSRRGTRGGAGGRRRRGKTSGSGGAAQDAQWGEYSERMNLHCIKGRILELSRLYQGSKYIQRRLHLAEDNEIQLVYDEVTPHLRELMHDGYGNFVLQGILECGTREMKDSIVTKVLDKGVVDLSFHVYGTRLVQRALETVESEDVASLVVALKGHVNSLIYDCNANHVVQCSIRAVNKHGKLAQKRNKSLTGNESEHGECDLVGSKEVCECNDVLCCLDHVVDEVTSEITEISTHPYGCRVVQRLLESCTGKHIDTVLDSLMTDKKVLRLFNHEYGNYVVQRVIEYGRPCDRETIFDEIMNGDNIINASKQKRSSNVIESMFQHGLEEQRNSMARKMLQVSLGILLPFPTITCLPDRISSLTKQMA